MPSDQPRPRNATATRDAILQSAIRHFTRAGYDGAVAHDIAAALAAHSAPGVETVAPFLIMLRSVSNPAAVRIVRAGLARHAGRRLSRQLHEPGRQLRSDVALAVMSGVLLLRQVIGTRALSRSSTDQLTAVLDGVFAAIIDTPLDAPGQSRP